MLGEGSGGGALALLPADRVVAAQHAWLSPLPPEGASAIVHRDLAHAADMARSQHVGALDLRASARWTASWWRSRTRPTSPRSSAPASAPSCSTSSPA